MVPAPAISRFLIGGQFLHYLADKREGLNPIQGLELTQLLKGSFSKSRQNAAFSSPGIMERPPRLSGIHSPAALWAVIQGSLGWMAYKGNPPSLARKSPAAVSLNFQDSIGELINHQRSCGKLI
jgi:hypothetical protein